MHHDEATGRVRYGGYDYVAGAGSAVAVSLGTEYLLTEGDIFVPLYEPDAHPFQRFLMIQ